MKNILHIALLTLTALLIYARYCFAHQARQPGTAIENLSSRKPVYKDSLNYKGKTVYLQQIDSNEFFDLRGLSFHWMDSILGFKELIDDTDNIHLRDTIVTQKFELGGTQTDSSATVLTLKFRNGHSIQLLSANLGEPVGYIYIKTIKELNSYLICHYYEQYSDYALFNKATGAESFLCGYPDVPPGKKALCCYHTPCDGCPAGFACSSEFLVYTIEKDSIKLEWENRVNWAPIVCKWKDNETLYMKIREGKDGDKNNTYYVKLRLPEFKK